MSKAAVNVSNPGAIRTETDSFGPIEVPAHRYWGAQTQRSLGNFKIGGERMPEPLIRALGLNAARLWDKLAIDALNEADRFTDLLRALDDVLPAVERHPWLRLVVSLRSGVGHDGSISRRQSRTIKRLR